MEHKGTKIITTDRLTLRPFRLTDAEAMFENWASDPVVTKFLTWTPHNSVEETRALLAVWEEESKRKDVYHWAIEFGGGLAGDIAVVWHSDGVAVVGYCIAQMAWGKGVMTEAFRAVIAYLFEEVGFHRIEASYSLENPASGRVQEKCGLLYEGTRRKAFRLLSTGQWTDIGVRAILDEDYFARK